MPKVRTKSSLGRVPLYEHVGYRLHKAVTLADGREWIEVWPFTLCHLNLFRPLPPDLRETCWLGKGGQISLPGRGLTRLHRYFYAQVFGLLEANTRLDNLCGKSNCCNPYHWRARTAPDADPTFLRDPSPIYEPEALATLEELAEEIETRVRPAGLGIQIACHWSPR